MTFKDRQLFIAFLSLHEDRDGGVKRGESEGVTLMVEANTSDRLAVAGRNAFLNVGCLT
jgi:hypothetical protein